MDGPTTLIPSGRLAQRLGISQSGLAKLERRGVIPAPSFRLQGRGDRLYSATEAVLISQIVAERENGRRKAAALH